MCRQMELDYQSQCRDCRAVTNSRSVLSTYTPPNHPMRLHSKEGSSFHVQTHTPGGRFTVVTAKKIVRSWSTVDGPVKWLHSMGLGIWQLEGCHDNEPPR
ncbi:MAG: hypothetical protein HN842_04455 [Gammaproteobacteria bacterium]|nr:hypothetical protein [Gammaproteobacteria bacterium]